MAAVVKSNLSTLTQRELLILLNQQVEQMGEKIQSFEATAANLNALEKRVLEQEVKWRTWSVIFGFLAGGVGAIISKFLNL